MKSNTDLKLKEALENSDAFIEQMKTMDDKKLSKHINLSREQMVKHIRMEIQRL